MFDIIILKLPYYIFSTYTSLFDVETPSKRDSMAIHLIGNRPPYKNNELHQNRKCVFTFFDPLSDNIANRIHKLHLNPFPQLTEFTCFFINMHYFYSNTVSLSTQRSTNDNCVIIMTVFSKLRLNKMHDNQLDVYNISRL